MKQVLEDHSVTDLPQCVQFLCKNWIISFSHKFITKLTTGELRQMAKLCENIYYGVQPIAIDINCPQCGLGSDIH